MYRIRRTAKIGYLNKRKVWSAISATADLPSLTHLAGGSRILEPSPAAPAASL